MNGGVWQLLRRETMCGEVWSSAQDRRQTSRGVCGSGGDYSSLLFVSVFVCWVVFSVYLLVGGDGGGVEDVEN